MSVYSNPRNSFNLRLNRSNLLYKSIGKGSTGTKAAGISSSLVRMKNDSMWLRHIGQRSSFSKHMWHTHVWRHGKRTQFRGWFWQTMHSGNTASDLPSCLWWDECTASESLPQSAQHSVSGAWSCEWKMSVPTALRAPWLCVMSEKLGWLAASLTVPGTLWVSAEPSVSVSLLSGCLQWACGSLAVGPDVWWFPSCLPFCWAMGISVEQLSSSALEAKNKGWKQRGTVVITLHCAFYSLVSTMVPFHLFNNILFSNCQL